MLVTMSTLRNLIIISPLHVLSLQLGLDLSYWTVVNHLFVWGSLGMYFLVTFAMQSDGLHQLQPSSFTFVGENSSSQIYTLYKPCYMLLLH